MEEPLGSVAPIWAIDDALLAGEKGSPAVRQQAAIVRALADQLAVTSSEAVMNSVRTQLDEELGRLRRTLRELSSIS